MMLMTTSLGRDLPIPPGLRPDGGGFVSSGSVFRTGGQPPFQFLGQTRSQIPGLDPVPTYFPSQYEGGYDSGTPITSGIGGKVLVGLAVVALAGGVAYYVIQRRKARAGVTVVAGHRRRRR